MSRTRIVAGIASILVACALLGAPDPAEGRGGKDADPPEGPRLKLLATPKHGFRPLRVTLTGELTGVALDDPQFCHAGIEWESRSPLGLDIRSVQDPRCLHPPEQVNVDLTFTKEVVLDREGIHQYRLILHRRDGERLLSNTQEIRVLSFQ